MYQYIVAVWLKTPILVKFNFSLLMLLASTRVDGHGHAVSSSTQTREMGVGREFVHEAELPSKVWESIHILTGKIDVHKLSSSVMYTNCPARLCTQIEAGCMPELKTIVLFFSFPFFWWWWWGEGWGVSVHRQVFCWHDLPVRAATWEKRRVCTAVDGSWTITRRLAHLPGIRMQKVPGWMDWGTEHCPTQHAKYRTGKLKWEAFSVKKSQYNFPIIHHWFGFYCFLYPSIAAACSSE